MKNILVLNAGSSSDKISFYQFNSSDLSSLTKDAKPLATATKPLATATKPLWQTETNFPADLKTKEQWANWLKDTLAPLTSQSKKSHFIDAIGHRVVHGGEKYTSAVIIDDQVKRGIATFAQMAPLHNKISLAQIEAMETILPIKQIAVFDTAFHHTLPEVVKLYPVPYAWYEKYGIRRFGFHGINHQYCAQEAARILDKDLASLSLIVCHLGSGCSLTAIDKGKSVNTTMGFTPLEGLMMASRSGSIDPGILIHLLQNKKMTVDEIDNQLNKESGLKGISQLSNDMREITAEMQKGNQFAQLAFDMFIQHLRTYICSMRASLNKLDALIFTGGIGENSNLVRERACAGLDFIGAEKVLVIKAGEDWEIARQSAQLLSSSAI